MSIRCNSILCGLCGYLYSKHVSTTALLLAVLCGMTVGCDRHEPNTAPTSHAAGGPAIRVVSLAPALSQMVVDLGQEHLLVGVAEHDRAAPAGLPVVGHWQDINTEKLLSLRPTHILTMTGKATPLPTHLTRLARSMRSQLIAYPSPQSVKDIARIILDDQEVISTDPNSHRTKSLGLVMGVPETANRLVTTMFRQITRIRDTTAPAPKRRVLLVISVTPWRVCGPGEFLDELLSKCGAINAARNATVGAPVYDKEKLFKTNPDVILMLLPNAPPLGPIASDPRLALLRGLAINAVRQDRVVLINDPQVHLPASSVSRIATAMAKAIHPELAVSLPAPERGLVR